MYIFKGTVELIAVVTTENMLRVIMADQRNRVAGYVASFAVGNTHAIATVLVSDENLGLRILCNPTYKLVMRETVDSTYFLEFVDSGAPTLWDIARLMGDNEDECVRNGVVKLVQMDIVAANKNTQMCVDFFMRTEYAEALAGMDMNGELARRIGNSFTTGLGELLKKCINEN